MQFLKVCNIAQMTPMQIYYASCTIGPICLGGHSIHCKVKPFLFSDYSDQLLVTRMIGVTIQFSNLMHSDHAVTHVDALYFLHGNLLTDS